MDLQSFDMERGESKRVASPGRCIYCGEAQTKLTDEHVVPYALGANTVIFERASCVSCQRLIQPYEQRVLRGQLGVFRARIDAPTRNRKSRPTSKRLYFFEVDGNGNLMRGLGSKELPLEDLPLTLSVWNLAPPRILGEGGPVEGHHGAPWTYTQREVAMKLTAQVREETGANHVVVRVDEINRNDFLRFLVKTAHAFAVSEHGFGEFTPLTTDLILGKSDDLAQFIGGDTGPSPHDDDPANMTELTLGRVVEGPVAGYIAVRLRLYPMLGTPAHIVVVGAPK